MRFVSSKMMLRSLFKRFFLSRWRGPGLRVRYWDGREAMAGKPPWTTTLHIRSPSVLRGMLRNPSLGFGHAYVDGRLEVEGDWQRFLQTAFTLGEGEIAAPLAAAWRLFRLLPRPVSPARAEANARFHYDVGNEFFQAWLDPSLTYSCAYFRTEQDDLATAQAQKRELICRKLDLKPGQTLLDVGCGWGSLLFHAMERYGVTGIGVTPSRAQAAYVETEAKRRKCADKLTLHVADWRSVDGTYDRVVSVGMYEHVGRVHGREFLRKWGGWLKPGGTSVLHTIGAMAGIPADPWMGAYIFPGTYLPSLAELAAHAASAGLVVADVENLWRHYALTLAAWSRNFAHARNAVVRMTDEQFFRTWWLYLNSAEASFRTGRILLWQMVLTKGKRWEQPLTREGWVL